MILTEIIARLEELEAKATKGPWQWFNGCSWWRLGGHDDEVGNGNVIKPTKDSDGHPNLIVSEANKALIAELRTHARTLIAAGKVAEAAKEAQKTGRDLFLGTAGMHNVAEASKRIDTAIAELDAAIKEQA